MATQAELLSLLIRIKEIYDAHRHEGEVDFEILKLQYSDMWPLLKAQHDEDGYGVLHYAAILEDYSCTIPLLIAFGADTELENKKGQTPLSLAVRKGTPESVQALVRGGANSKLIGKKDGATLLHLAVYLKREDIAAVLLQEKCVDINAFTEFDETALDLALSQRNIRMEKLLRRWGVNTPVPLPEDMSVREYQRQEKAKIIAKGACQPLPDAKPSPLDAILSSL